MTTIEFIDFGGHGVIECTGGRTVNAVRDLTVVAAEEVTPVEAMVPGPLADGDEEVVAAGDEVEGGRGAEIVAVTV